MRQAVLDLPGGVEHHQAAGVEVHRRVGDHELQALVARELLAERLALQQPLRGQVQRALRHADPAHRVGQAAAGQALLGDDEALALAAEQVAHRDAAVGELDDRVAAGGVGAQPLRLALDLPARGVGRHEDERVVAMPAPSVSLVLATTIENAAPRAPVMHHLRPLMTHSSPSRTADVSRFVGSEDATSGSVIAKHERVRPSASGRRKVSSCSALPAMSSVCMLPSSGAIAFRPSEARPLTPHSWLMSAMPSTPTPRPPHSSGRCGV
jgi:hypothetical protein